MYPNYVLNFHIILMPLQVILVHYIATLLIQLLKSETSGLLRLLPFLLSTTTLALLFKPPSSLVQLLKHQPLCAHTSTPISPHSIFPQIR